MELLINAEILVSDKFQQYHTKHIIYLNVMVLCQEVISFEILYFVFNYHNTGTEIQINTSFMFEKVI
jgi:hypothetical protein